MHLLAVLLGTRALAGIGLVGDDDLVDQVFVVLAVKHGLRHIHLDAAWPCSFRSSSCISSLPWKIGP